MRCNRIFSRAAICAVLAAALLSACGGGADASRPNSEAASSSEASAPSDSEEESASASESDEALELKWNTEAVSGGAKLTGYDAAGKAPSGEVTLPAEVDGNVITAIGEGAFEGNSQITAVTIPKSVEKIGMNAFASCTNLKSVTMESSVKSIEDYAFADCTSLADITFSKTLRKIGTQAFFDCTALEKVCLPENMFGESLEIKQYAFSGCENLKKIFVPLCVKSLENRLSNESTVTDIYYAGSEDDWKGMNHAGIEDSVEIHYMAKETDLYADGKENSASSPDSSNASADSAASSDVPSEPAASEQPASSPDSSDTAPSEPSETQLTAYRNQLLLLVNNARNDKKLNAVKADTALDAAAQKFAEEWSSQNLEENPIKTNGRRPNGEKFETILDELHIAYTFAGIAFKVDDYSAPETVMRAWIHEQSQVIFEPDYSRLGVGYSENSEGKTFWVLLFVGYSE